MGMIIGWITMCAAAVFDVRTKKIPLRLIGAAAACSALAGVLLLRSGTCTAQELATSLMPGALLLLLSFASREAIGYGDGLLLLVTGPLFGWRRMLLCVPVALLLTTAASVVLLALKKANRKTQIPFVPFLAAGMGVITLAF